MRYPSPAAAFDVPFIIGPVGGSLDDPPGFKGEGDTAPWFVRLRTVDRARLRHDPFLASTYDGAACVIGIAPYVRELLDQRKIRRFEVMSDTGIESLPAKVDRSGRSGPVRLLYVGRIVRTKGVRDAIRAIPRLSAHRDVFLDVVGDGFDRDACERLSDELAVRGRVQFHGYLERARIDEFYRDADIFVFPSYREPGGNVVFEAMSHGLPLVVSDRGGPGYTVDDTCGIRVTPTTPDQYAFDLAAAISELVDDERRRLQLGDGARARVSQIALWDNKMDALDQIYAEVTRG
jgi:glycosyltransferase involved in cell wall biosynthesis